MTSLQKDETYLLLSNYYKYNIFFQYPLTVGSLYLINHFAIKALFITSKSNTPNPSYFLFLHTFFSSY
jgi:hypothetical protein